MQSPGAEIIVLDSDDDTPLACTKRKAEDNSGCSSDVEVVEAVTRRTQDTSSSGKEVKVESGHKPGDFGTRELLAFSEDDASESDKPQLFSPAEDRVLHVTEGQDFQAASSIPSDDQLLPPSADPDDSHHLLSEIQVDSSDVLPTSLARLDSDNVIEIDDEWGTGDDELVRANGDDVEGVLELTDDEVEEILKPKDESPATSGEAINHCPFCGIDLTSFSSLVSPIARFPTVLPHRFCIRTCSHTLLPAAIRFLLQPLCLLSHLTIRRRRHYCLRPKDQRVAMHFRYSCPRTRRITPGRKPRTLKIAVSGQQKQTEGAERPLFTKSYKACPSQSMLSATAKFLA